MSRSFEGYLESRLLVTNITALWKKLCRKGGEQLCHVGRKLFTGIASVLILSQLCRAYDEQLDVADLINRAMQAQVAAQNDSARFQYVQKELEKLGTRTYRIVETDVGAVERLVAINDNDLPPQQRIQEDQWLDKLLANPSIQKKRQKDDAEEEARRQKIIAVLGKAFLYDIEGTEDEGRIVRVHFTPNPKFHADSREAKVCAGLEGTMWIDQSKQRFTRAEGTLIRGVDFGWGLFGHLDKGGHFAIEQTEVNAGVWRITDLDVNFKGSMLIFKSLKIRVHEHASKFRRVSDHLSLEEAVEILRHDASFQPAEVTRRDYNVPRTVSTGQAAPITTR